MTIRLSIDRFEGDKKQIAVLLAEDGTTINFPKACSPRAPRPATSSRSRSSATSWLLGSWPKTPGGFRTSSGRRIPAET